MSDLTFEPVSETPSDVSPIFIVGSARTGTSILVGALRHGAKLPGYNEAHYLTMIQGLIYLASEHLWEQRRKDGSKDVMMSNVTTETITSDMLMMAKMRMEMQFPGKKMWFDKTPDNRMLRAIPYILTMWPKAYFIFTKRRAIENMQSRLKKFQHLSFERNCEHWAGSMTFWNKFKGQIPESQRLEIDQREMSLQPRETAEKIGAMLGLSKELIGGMAYIFKNDRYESTGGVETNTISLEQTGWTDEQTEIYKRICSPINKEWGYSEDSSYYLQPGA